MELDAFTQEVAALCRSVGFWEARVDKFWVEGRELHILVKRDLPPGTMRLAGLFPNEPTLPDCLAARGRRHND